MVDRLERLINLVIALRETRRPLTVEAINDRVAGYEGDRSDAWRRMFERDKADLREMGVPIRTEPLGRYDDTIGYRIHPDDYDLPDVAFTPAELTALALSVELTGLGDDAAPGLDKLAVDAGDEARSQPVAAGPQRLPLQLGLDAPNRGVLVEALRTRRRVRFTYTSPGSDEGQTRRVEPHALLHHRGRWYLVGFDRAREADRTFRLDRVIGDVALTGEAGAYQIPDQVPEPADVIPGARAEVVDALVAASPAVAWAVARRSRGAGQVQGTSTADDAAELTDPADGEAIVDVDQWRRFTIRVTDPDAFIAWILELGAEAAVLDPPALRESIITRLAQVAR